MEWAKRVKRKFFGESEEERIREAYKNVDPTDEKYPEMLSRMETASRINNGRKDSLVKRACDVAKVVVVGGVAYMSYKIDKTEEIPKNKQLGNFFGKIFKMT